MNTNESQAALKVLRITLIILAAFIAVEIVGAVRNLSAVPANYNSISVSGQGEATAVPDIATFSFSVSADAKTVADAQSQVTDKVNKILDGLKGMGIAEKDIKTSDYSVYPKYVYSSAGLCTAGFCPPSKQVQDGYTASHSISVKVRKTDDAGKALALAGDDGATNISGVSFAVDDPDAVTAEARASAIADAKSKAQALAKDLGVRIVRVASYSDNSQGGPVPVYAQAMGMGAADSKAAPVLPTGENKVTVSVTVTYEIR